LVNAYIEEVNIVFQQSCSLFALYKIGKDSDHLDPYPVSSEFQHNHKDKMPIDKPDKIAGQFPTS